MARYTFGARNAILQQIDEHYRFKKINLFEKLVSRQNEKYYMFII